MSTDRYVLLGLGRARSRWFGDVALWTTSGAIPAEITKCLAVGELHQKLNALQPYSALLVEAGIVGLDRDLIDTAKRSGVPVIVVETAPERTEEWIALGATAVLPSTFAPSDLLYTLTSHTAMISRGIAI